MKLPLRARIRWHLLRLAEHVLLRLLGRPLRCAECGRPLFRALPFVWRGRLKVFGASRQEVHHLVRVSFTGEDTLELRHVELDKCPVPERSWAR